MELESFTIRISPTTKAVRVGSELTELPPTAVELITRIINAVLEPDPEPGDEAPVPEAAA
ncbi:hypothetical protein I6F15_04520 [Bradyrhizobium sp. BRP14]|nr:hypothetical protein [Bradyrhizobium sp. BRP14]